MATIRKRGSRWQVQVRRQGQPPLTNSFLLRTDAEAWGRQKEVEIDRGELTQHPNKTSTIRLLCILERYLIEVTPKKRGAIPEAARLRCMMKTDLATIRLANLKSSHLAEYRDKRLQLVSKASVRREMSILQNCLSLARLEWCVIHSNPMDQIKKPTDSVPRDRRPSISELTALATTLARARNKLPYLVFKFALATGMRRSEILSLTWSNIDFEGRTALLPMTKNGKPRRVPLSMAAQDTLLKRQTLAGQNRLPMNAADCVFPISANALRLCWERAKKHANVDDLRFHDLRHEAITRYFEMGLSMPEVALISGHRDTRMLLRYVHLQPSNVSKRIDSLTVQIETEHGIMPVK